MTGTIANIRDLSLSFGHVRYPDAGSIAVADHAPGTEAADHAPLLGGIHGANLPARLLDFGVRPAGRAFCAMATDCRVGLTHFECKASEYWNQSLRPKS
ncbi:hypothetical protein [Tropicimonas aquimaris]|uniref:Uncharacterized protein n=1 Tax=Tropicimonas aquimaris TaxID=914152 RepID=A0ABW3IWE1_9RHOB